MARFPNGPEGFVTTFKDLGSFIALYEEITASGTQLETKLVAAVEQQDYEYETVKTISTFVNNMVSARSNLNTARTNLVSSVSNYLTTVAATQLGSTATTASGVIADLVTTMRGATEGAAVSGLLVLENGSYDTFFLTEYGIQLPVTSGSILLTSAEAQDIISGTLPSIRRQVDESYAV